MVRIEERIREAVKFFWETRSGQATRQGNTSGLKDQGERSAVTGGAQMDGFVLLVRDLLIESGVPASSIFTKTKLEIPGFYRPEKKWDLLVVADGHLLASIEFKSQIGPSFGNNYNNRTEEALGNATDLLTAYREGVFKLSNRPWLGYLMLLEETERSLSPVALKEPHFKALNEFRGASYAKRYELLITKLLRERLYDYATFLLSNREGGLRAGDYVEPLKELSFERFLISLLAHVNAFFRMEGGQNRPQGSKEWSL